MKGLKTLAALGMAGIACASAQAQDAGLGSAGTGAASASSPAAGTSETAKQSDSADSLGDIVVTARRRDERLQTVPVSVTAFSSAALQQANVRDLQDLTVVTPGLHFGYVGGKNTTSVLMRGLGNLPVGAGTPAVVAYLNNVPLPAVGTNIPTYDIANVQVLKGPQGTLFGRNTLGGAILVGTQAPTYNLGGYVQGDYGRYNYRALEGAINIPIVDDKIALRLAGQIRRQDPRTKNLSGGKGFDDIHQDSFRASLLVEPADGVKSITVFDYFKVHEQSGGGLIYRLNPGAVPGISELIDSQLAAYYQGQQNNFHGTYSDLAPGEGHSYGRQIGISNDTSVDLGGFTIRNIFGFRKNRKDEAINTGANGPLSITIDGVTSPFILFHGSAVEERKYITEELQLLGTAMDGRLNWIAGAFYGHDAPTKKGEGSHFLAFVSPAFGSGDGPYASAHTENTNYALFGQLGYKLTDRLTFNAGLRYSWDRVKACGGVIFTDRYATYDECKAAATLNLQDGIGVVQAKGSAPSWTVGLDYQVSDRTFLYLTSRRGYRGVNVNTPLFETPYTTGGTVVPPFPGGPGCTGPDNVCPDLRPFQTTKKETITDVEIGVKTDWAIGMVRGRANVSAYYSKYKNALQNFNPLPSGIYASAPDFPNNQTLGINAADETIKGVEFELTVIPFRNLSLGFNGSAVDSRVDKIAAPTALGFSLDKSQVTLPTPDFSGTITGSYTVPLTRLGGNLVFSGDYFFTDKFGGDLGENLPGYHLTNFRITWNGVAGSNLDAAVLVRNAFDKKYIAAFNVLGPTFPVNAVSVGEQRVWAVELHYQF